MIKALLAVLLVDNRIELNQYNYTLQRFNKIEFHSVDYEWYLGYQTNFVLQKLYNKISIKINLIKICLQIL